MAEADDLLALIRQHDEEAQRAEAAAVTAVSGGLWAAVRGVFRWLQGAWARLFGPPQTEAEGDALAGLLDALAFRITGIALDAEDSLLYHAQRGRLLGIDQGFAEARAVPRPADGDVSTETRTAVQIGIERARELIMTAAERVRGLDSGSLHSIEQRAAGAQQALRVLERTARTTFNTELNAGIEQAADALGAELVWVAERDACVHCLRLSGEIRRNGVFDWRLTFGDKAYAPRDATGVPVPLHRPPRHPNCRCRLTLWFGHDTAAAAARTHDWAQAKAEALARGDQVAADAADKAAAAALASAEVPLPTVLRREAERSVLNGYALPSESEGVRVRAAEKLLAQIGSGRNAPSPSGWKVPVSVKKRAQTALKKGTFTTGSVPTSR